MRRPVAWSGWTLALVLTSCATASPAEKQRAERAFPSVDKAAGAVAGVGPAGIVGSAGTVSFEAFEFTPIGSGSYEINWPGPPRHDMNWADARFYAPKVRLKSAAPYDVAVCFWVKDDVFLWPDTELGSFCVNIPKGASSPAKSEDVVALTSDPEGELRLPTDAPDRHFGSFWLGCTKAGKLRGNDGKHNQTGDVYLEAFGTSRNPGWEVDGWESSRHRVRCY